MVSVIEVSAKIETMLVWVSAFMLAAGSAGFVLVQSLPEAYKVVGTTVCGGFIAMSTAILAIWHKFVNTLQINAPQTVNAQIPIPLEIPVQVSMPFIQTAEPEQPTSETATEDPTPAPTTVAAKGKMENTGAFGSSDKVIEQPEVDASTTVPVESPEAY
jgi:hypothetical protein